MSVSRSISNRASLYRHCCAALATLVVLLCAFARAETPAPPPPKPAAAKKAPKLFRQPAHCAGIVLVGSKAQMASSPRKDQDAERLALRRTDELVAKESEYQRIAADLKAIRASTKDPGARGVFASFGTRALMLSMRPTIIAAAAKGEYKGLDCLNAWYGGEQRNVLKSLDLVLIYFPALYHPKHIAAVYAKHPDVLRVEPDTAIGDGDDITLCNEQLGGTHHYLFRHGQGDCPAGCLEAEYRGYAVTTAGVVTPLPGWKRTNNGQTWLEKPTRPDWVTPGCFKNGGRYPGFEVPKR